MCECELRLTALELATDLARNWGCGEDKVVAMAQKFYDFLKCTECEEAPGGEVN